MFGERLSCLFYVALCAAAWPLFLPASDDDSPVFVRAWKVSDFDAVISVGLEGYRDHDNGRRGFTRGTCVKCHRLAGEGPEGGVDLEKVGERHDPRSLLEMVLSPDHPADRAEVSRRFGVETREGGYLDPFAEEDILDLLAYLMAGGDAKDPAFAK